MRKVNRYTDDTADSRQQLRRHFDAVLTTLIDDFEASLSVALDRLELRLGENWTPAERSYWREQLAWSRLANILKLKRYQLREQFPINHQFAEPTPIFVDSRGTACAVGFLMQRSGWSDAVETVARTMNLVFIHDVTGGPVLEWILQSGLTQEEAALIQPSYPCNDPLAISTTPVAGGLILLYSPADGNLSVSHSRSWSSINVRSSNGSFIAEGAHPDTFAGPSDAIDADELIVRRPTGTTAGATNFGTVLPPHLAIQQLIEDLSIGSLVDPPICSLFVFPESGVVRWDTGQTIPGAEERNPRPGARLDHLELRRAWLGAMDLTATSFEGSDLTAARLTGSTLADANLKNVNLAGAYLTSATLTGADLAGSDLSGALLFFTTLAGADLSGANLTRTRLINGDMTGADLSGANIAVTTFGGQEMRDADLSGATLMSSNFSGARSFETVSFSAETIYNQWTKFPEGFDPLEHGLTLVLSSAGDLDGAGGLTATDVDMLTWKLREPLPTSWLDEMFDLNGDATIDQRDLDEWVHHLKGTWHGDANLDGQFDSRDLIAIFAAGQYEDGINENSGWATGDWNGDGDFTSQDLIAALQDGGYEQGPRVAVTPVPEPASVRWFLAALLSSAVAARRRDRA